MTTDLKGGGIGFKGKEYKLKGKEYKLKGREYTFVLPQSFPGVTPLCQLQVGSSIQGVYISIHL